MRILVSWYYNVSILDFTAAKDDGSMLITEAIIRAKLQSNCHH